MITIKCTESEKRKLCNSASSIMCSTCYALGACKEFAGHCSKCKKHRSKYIQWDIVKSIPKKKRSEPKKKKSEGDGSSCHNCYWNTWGKCRCIGSPHCLQSIEDVMKVKPHCDMYSAYEGDD